MCTNVYGPITWNLLLAHRNLVCHLSFFLYIMSLHWCMEFLPNFTLVPNWRRPFNLVNLWIECSNGSSEILFLVQSNTELTWGFLFNVAM